LVSELQPRAVVLENVAALLTRGLDRVLGTLAEIGYDAEWHCIPAAYVGAPHIRDRVFVIGLQRMAQYANSIDECSIRKHAKLESNATASGNCDRKNPLQDSDVSDSRCSRVQQQGGDCQIEQGSGIMGGIFWDGTQEKPVAEKETLADTASVYAQGLSNRSGQVQSWRGSWWATEPDVGRVAHGIPARVDRLRGLGNAVVPQVAELVGKMVLQRLRSGKSEIRAPGDCQAP